MRPYTGATYRGYRLMPHSWTLFDELMSLATTVVGERYWWGGGSLASAKEFFETPRATSLESDPFKFDCSGLAQWLMVAFYDLASRRQINVKELSVFNVYAAGLLDDYNSTMLRELCDKTTQVSPGDLVFYDKHVEVCIGNGMLIGAMGGTSETHGDNQLACVQIRPFGHRANIRMVGRPKEQYRL